MTPKHQGGREGRGGGLSENVKTELGQKRHQAGACNGYTVKVSFHSAAATKSAKNCGTLKATFNSHKFP